MPRALPITGMLLFLSSPAILVAQRTDVQPALDIKIVCAAFGERVPRQDASGARSGTDRLRGRQIHYLVGPMRFGTLDRAVAQVETILAERGPMPVRIRPDAGAVVLDVATALAGLAARGVDDVVVAWKPTDVRSLRGDERTRVVDRPAVEVPIELRTTASDATGVRIPPAVAATVDDAGGPAAVVDIGQSGECALGGTVFFDPERDGDDQIRARRHGGAAAGRRGVDADRPRRGAQGVDTRRPRQLDSPNQPPVTSAARPTRRVA